MIHALIMPRILINRLASVIVKQFVDKTRICLLTNMTVSVNQRFPTITTPQTASNQTPE